MQFRGKRKGKFAIFSRVLGEAWELTVRFRSHRRHVGGSAKA
jgi:hypothetical protein